MEEDLIMNFKNLKLLMFEYVNVLIWFYERIGEEIGWFVLLNGIFFVNKVKGIYKLYGWWYVFSVCQFFDGLYNDVLYWVVDGFWYFWYYYEGDDLLYFINWVLKVC